MQVGLIIPQLFYDCIARIIPGFMVLLTFFFIWGGEIYTKIYLILDKNSWFIGFTFAMTTYLISLLLEGLYFFISKILRLIVLFKKKRKPDSHIQVANEKQKTDPVNSGGRTQKRQLKIWNEAIDNIKKNHKIPVHIHCKRNKPISVYMAYDYIRMVNPEAGSRIVKLKAEKNLCRNLKYGWSVILVIYILVCLYVFVCRKDGDLSYFKPSMAILSLGAVISAIHFKMIRANDLFLFSIYNHWLLIESEVVKKS
jgi:hypothetical protein